VVTSASLGAFSTAATVDAQQKRRCVRAAALVADAPPAATESSTNGAKRPLKVLIAGAGIGGLVLALALLKKGIQVEVFERDITAIRGEGKYRGPIQVCWLGCACVLSDGRAASALAVA
jgi:zeaxanthin epoxidase